MNNTALFWEWYNREFIDDTPQRTIRILRGECMYRIPDWDLFQELCDRQVGGVGPNGQLMRAHAELTLQVKSGNDPYERVYEEEDIIDPRDAPEWGDDNWDDVLFADWLRWCVYEFYKDLCGEI